MKVSFFGTRGSVPVAGPNFVRYGGNTTCLRIESDCLPEHNWLVIDAGSGFVPLSFQGLQAGIEKLTVLQTHHHHDHTQGALLSPLVFHKGIRISWYGPHENGMGPQQMFETVMRPPMFPVDFDEVASHFSCKGIVNPTSKAFVIHPEGGLKLLTVDELERFEATEPPQVPIGRGKYPIRGSLIIRMYKSHHPERTISYRFEERPTEKVFVFLTDHENQDGLPQALQRHLNRANLLVMDSQYTREKYNKQTAGFGHGTPDYCAHVAFQTGALQLGLTHHDPASSDEVVDQILEHARQHANTLAREHNVLPCYVFACADYMEVEV